MYYGFFLTGLKDLPRGAEGRVVTPPHKLAIGKLIISNYVLRLLVITELWDFKLRDFVDDLLLDRGNSNYVITTFQITEFR